LLLTYCASLVFTLRTHRQLYGASRQRTSTTGSIWRPLPTMAAATVGVAWMSELLVDTVTTAARSLGMSSQFAGVLVVATIGNAAEHLSAVLMAARDDMDAALAIAVGSSTHIALFVGPLLVFLSYLVSPHPLDLLFTDFEVIAVGPSVLTIALMAVYVILALGFYFLPGVTTP
jgi:Ca2+:H+ antiporter